MDAGRQRALRDYLGAESAISDHGRIELSTLRNTPSPSPGALSCESVQGPGMPEHNGRDKGMTVRHRQARHSWIYSYGVAWDV
jgi:hypothetical protein